ncbi:MAG TPA: YbaB/EbfC family nucleoid-associated protein [Bacilli bacterium]|nr:YbaB/EbfC family nucleoid-associated protein [Bacilli bacterium]
MNIQAMMKQAQNLQKDMLNAKKEINAMEFETKNSFLTMKANGEKQITSVKIDIDQLEKEDIELLEDMILVAVNDLNKQIDKVTEQKMGKYTQGMPGLF